MTELGKAGVCIVLPVLNEIHNIVPLLDGIRQELTSIPHTVCLIDDGSRDGTVETIRKSWP
jgi:glycosyltransferase involved in cell wall biosynthesis